MKKITLDTNCFFDYFERAPIHIQDLIDLQAEGRIEIAMTTRVMADTYDKRKGPGVSPIWVKIQSFPILEIVGSAFRLVMSRLDSGDYLVSDSDENLMNRLRKIMVNAQIEDIDHLFGHIIAERDIFVTSDSHFLDYREQLKNEFDVMVLNPEETIQLIQESG